MAEYADKLYARRRGHAVAAVSDSPINAVSGGHRRELARRQTPPLAVPPGEQPQGDPWPV